jgi:hypothetical protein
MADDYRELEARLRVDGILEKWMHGEGKKTVRNAADAIAALRERAERAEAALRKTAVVLEAIRDEQPHRVSAGVRTFAGGNAIWARKALDAKNPPPA